MSFSSVAARAARILTAIALLVAVGATLPSCGSDGGTSSFLPPGQTTDAPPGKFVIYVAQAYGNRIDAYHLGTDGLLPALPFDTIFVDQPRRLAVNNGVLYASLYDRVVSIRLGADGSLPNVPSSSTLSRYDYDPVDLLVRDDILYVAASGLGLLQSFPLPANGDLTLEPRGAGQSEYAGDFLSLALNGRYIYAGSRDIEYIDVFLLDLDGNVPIEAEPQNPQDVISLPDDIEIRDDILYVTSASDRCIRAYRIQSNGFLAGDYDSRTKTEEYYEDILLDGDIMYTLAYNAGRIDVYSIDPDGMLPKQGPIFSTSGDPASYPSKMFKNEGILYVAQAGLNRVDAYVLDANGMPSTFPTSSTYSIDNSLPLDLVLYELN